MHLSFISNILLIYYFFYQSHTTEEQKSCVPQSRRKTGQETDDVLAKVRDNLLAQHIISKHPSYLQLILFCIFLHAKGMAKTAKDVYADKNRDKIREDKPSPRKASLKWNSKHMEISSFSKFMRRSPEDNLQSQCNTLWDLCTFIQYVQNKPWKKERLYSEKCTSVWRSKGQQLMKTCYNMDGKERRLCVKWFLSPNTSAELAQRASFINTYLCVFNSSVIKWRK